MQPAPVERSRYDKLVASSSEKRQICSFLRDLIFYCIIRMMPPSKKGEQVPYLICPKRIKV